MIFPSYSFLLVFLPLVLAVWLSRLPLRARLLFLTMASYVFYGWWDYRFTALLAASTLVDYQCGRWLVKPELVKRRGTVLGFSLVTNLGLLGFFKYYDFFAESLATALGAVGVEAGPVLLDVVLPIGISFYTFQSLSYTIDIYRGRAEPAPDFLHFAAYVSMFPQLVAGPIVRYEAMALQLRELAGRRVTSVYLAHGTWLFSIGLAKKLLIADNTAPLADSLFDGSGPVAFGFAWLGSLAYTVQLYFDFSGYSDMAIGLGLILGFRFPINFDSPYQSRSIADFWNRWHITLSHFLRDYLFIPLGGSRAGIARTLRNLVITMFLGGLWHGAQWTFVVWGLFHGVLLGGHAWLRERMSWRLPAALSVGLTFLCVHFGWVLFRAPSFGRAGEIYRGLFGLSGSEALFEMLPVSSTFGSVPAFVNIGGGPRVLPFVILGLALAFAAPNSLRVPRPLNRRSAFAFATLLVLCIAQLGRETPFLYFQF